MEQPEQAPQSPPASTEGWRAGAFLTAARVVWLRRSLLLFGIGLGLLFGGLYYVAAPRTYQSTAQVLVVKKRPDEVTGKDTRNLAIEDYVATQQSLIGSAVVIDRAIAKRSLGGLATFEDWEKDQQDGGDTLPEVIRKRLNVTRNRGSVSAYNNAILDLTFRGKSPEDTQTVMEAVLSSYSEFLDETYRVMSDDTFELVVKAREELAKELQRKEAAYQAFRAESPVLPAKGADGRDIRHEGLGSIQIRRASLALAATEIEAQLAAINDALQAKRSPEVVLAMIVEFTNKGDAEDPRKERSAVPLPNALLPLLIEEQKLLANYGPNHSEVRSIRQRIEAAREVATRPAAGLNSAAARTEPAAASAAEAIKAHVTHLQQKLDYIRTMERMLASAFDKEHAAARTLTSYEIKEEQLRTDIARTQSLYDGIVKRLQDVSLVRQAGGYQARVITPPLLGRKVAPKALLVFPLALLAGTLAGLGLVYLAEISDQSFRSAEEVGKRLDLSVVGYIPHFDHSAAAAPSTGLAATLEAYHQPRSPLAEAYRGMRTALYFGARGKRNQLIQVTSSVPGEGKSTVAANLAISIAQSGKRTLLIDADLRRPTLHQLFGIAADHGLVSLLAEECRALDAIQQVVLPNLSILPCGATPPNPAEVLTSERFRALLESFRPDYDFIILDSPPLLAVTDASVIAPTVDGVILVVRMQAHSRQAAERSRAALTDVGAAVLGVVVNDVERRHVGYGPGYGYYNYEEDAETSAPPGPPSPEQRLAKFSKQRPTKKR